MPKRPCAITITDDNNHILCGDKFGDVYALPLLGTDEPIPANQSTATAASSNWRKSEASAAPDHVEVKVEAKAHKPAASELTVHSGRNLRALREQQLRANQHGPKKSKPATEFEHEVLLGHVSMLTDIAAVRVSTDAEGKGMSVSRTYILTADRDEHIRVSRGQPQAHIIENFCFGHTQFVSKLCLPQPEILVSGGGDDCLFIWDWRRGRLLRQLDMRGPLKKYWDTHPRQDRQTRRMPASTDDDDAAQLQHSGNVVQEAIGADASHDSHEEAAEESPQLAPMAVSGIFARSTPKVQSYQDPVSTTQTCGRKA